jgi:hypothetical protein
MFTTILYSSIFHGFSVPSEKITIKKKVNENILLDDSHKGPEYNGK